METDLLHRYPHRFLAVIRFTAMIRELVRTYIFTGIVLGLTAKPAGMVVAVSYQVADAGSSVVNRVEMFAKLTLKQIM